MNLPAGISMLQNTDRWIGSPICFVLTLVRKLFGRKFPAPAVPSRIAFLKFAEQGSTVLAYPAFSRAAAMVGSANLYIVVFEDNRFIVDALDIIPPANVITISTASLIALATGTLRAIYKLRSLGIDAIIDLEFLTRFSAIVSFLTGARSRVGFHVFFGGGPYRGDLMTHRLVYNPHLHTSQTFEMMVEALTRDPRQLPALDYVPSRNQRIPKFEPTTQELSDIENLLLRENPAVTTAPLILLNPNAGDLLPLRRWPPQRFAELARRILQQFPNIFVAFTGAPSEAAAINGLTEQVQSDRVISLAGKTTLRQMLVLYHRASILVTNDSGPAHFASMTPIHIIALFGPETPKLFAPRSKNARVLWAGIACSPCVNAHNNRQSPCRNNLCMQAITVDEVFAEVAQIVSSSSFSMGPSGDAVPSEILSAPAISVPNETQRIMQKIFHVKPGGILSDSPFPVAGAAVSPISDRPIGSSSPPR
jgi:ADP-heptose:LPS heptosyltransferase